MIETHELYRLILEAAGAKRVAHALGLSVSHVYRMARHPMDDGDPDGTGTRNDLDRLELLVDVLAARPHARSTLRMLKLWFDTLFARALDGDEGIPMDDIERVHRLGQIVREFGEFMAHAGPHEDPVRVAKEGAEAIEAISSYLRGLAAGRQR